MTYLSKDIEAEALAVSGQCAPTGQWNTLMKAWLGGPVQQLAPGDMPALTELMRRRAAVSVWRKDLGPAA